jgi:hypothetical protein
MASLIEQTQPLSMIYCASPGSFAVLDHLIWLLSECHSRNIFCALVCTNMWTERNRNEIVQQFCRILNIVHPNISPKQEDYIIYYDNVALVAMVNSQEYIDKHFYVRKPPYGVEEFIFGIAKSLKRDLMFAWFHTVAQNTSFWTKISSKLSYLFKVPTETLTSFCENAANFLDSLFDLSDFSSDYSNMAITSENTSFTTKDTVNSHLKYSIDYFIFIFLLGRIFISRC